MRIDDGRKSSATGERIEQPAHSIEWVVGFVPKETLSRHNAAKGLQQGSFHANRKGRNQADSVTRKLNGSIRSSIGE